MSSMPFVVDDAVVPEHRTHRFVDAYNFASPGQALNDGPVYRLPFGCVFAFCVGRVRSSSRVTTRPEQESACQW